MYKTDELMHLFTDHFRKDSESNIYKLMQIFSEELQLLETTNNLILDWRDIDFAQGHTLDLIGSNINQPRGMAIDEVYRVLLKSKIARNLSDGSIDSIINVIALALSADKKEIQITEGWTKENGVKPYIEMSKIPLGKLLETGMDPLNFVALIQKTIAAGVRVNRVELDGTFELGTTAVEYDEKKGLANMELTIGGYLGAIYVAKDVQKLPI